MAIWRYTVKYVDLLDGYTEKVFTGDFADYTTARAKADALLIDLQAMTEAYIYQDELTEVGTIAGAASGSASVFQRVSATVDLGGNKKANLKFPSPVSAIFAGNALITDAPLWTALMANFAVGEWNISDGDNYSGTIRGKRVFVNSGRTNLPT